MMKVLFVDVRTRHVEDDVQLVLDSFFCARHLRQLKLLAVAAIVGLAELQETSPHRVLL